MSDLARRLSRMGPFQAARTEPFPDAASAWFWTMGALTARRDGAARSSSAVARPGDPDDVIKCLDRLFQRGRIGAMHVQVLRRWGERGIPPDPSCLSEQRAACLWQDALQAMAGLLEKRGMILAPDSL